MSHSDADDALWSFIFFSSLLSNQPWHWCTDKQAFITELSDRLLTNKICGDRSPSLNQALGCQNKMKLQCRKDRALFVCTHPPHALWICRLTREHGRYIYLKKTWHDKVVELQCDSSAAVLCTFVRFLIYEASRMKSSLNLRLKSR